MAKDNEAQEEAEPRIPEDQLEEMDDVLGIAADDDGEPAEQMPEGKESAKPQDQPPADKPAEDADGKGGTESKATEPTEKGTETPAEADGKPKQPEDKDDKDDPAFEVVSRDGVRNVKLSALKTTYQQHGALQAKHKAVKPIFDLADQSGIPVDKMFDFLVIGIQTVTEAANRKQSLPGSTPAGNKPEGYQGPFESAAQEKELQESDPILYRTTKSLWEQNRALSEAIVNLTGKLEQHGRAAAGSQPAGRPTPQNAEPSPERKRVDGILSGLQTVHADYFKSHPERADAFKTFLGTKFSSVPLESVDDNFMAVAFQTFDPSYYAAWHEEQVKARLEKSRQTRRRTFGETDSVRGSVASSMTEQQELMADILNF